MEHKDPQTLQGMPQMDAPPVYPLIDLNQGDLVKPAPEHKKRGRIPVWLVVIVTCGVLVLTSFLIIFVMKVIRPNEMMKDIFERAVSSDGAVSGDTDLSDGNVELPAMLDGFTSYEEGEQPIFYADDGRWYAAAGSKSIELRGAEAISNGLTWINGMMNSNNRLMYYLADVNGGSGALMRLKLGDPNAVPEVMLRNVSVPRMSSDGARVLFLRNMEGELGELYLWDGDAEEKIASSVSEFPFGFSPNGMSCFYLTDGKEGETLFVKHGSAASVKVVTESKSNTIQAVFLFDDGSVVYELRDGEKFKTFLYRFTGKETQAIGEGGIDTAFMSGDLLCYTGSTLYYVGKDAERQLVSGEYDYVIYPHPVEDNIKPAQDSRFLLLETVEEPEYTLSEYVPGRGTVRVAEASGYFTDVSKDFTWVAYQKDDKQYLARRTDNAWKPDIFVADNAYYCRFDNQGIYLYYHTLDGRLGRYTLATGENEQLCTNILEVITMGSDAFAINSDYQLLHIMSDGIIEIAENVYSVRESYNGGFYVVVSSDMYDIYYYPPDAVEGIKVAEGVDAISQLNGYIE